MPENERFDFRKLTATQKSAVLLRVRACEKLMLRRTAKVFHDKGLHEFLMRGRFRSLAIHGPDEDQSFDGMGSEFFLMSQGAIDGISLALHSPRAPMQLNLTACCGRRVRQWSHTADMGSVDDVCKFLNRLFVSLPPHAVRFQCGLSTGPTALLYREQLDMLRSWMHVSHPEMPLDALVPLLRDERRLSRQSYEIELMFGDITGIWSAPPADPQYCELFEQIAHLPRISLHFNYFCDNFWALVMEVVVPILEAALVTHRPRKGEMRIVSIEIACRLDLDAKPVYRPRDLLERLATKIRITDQLEIYRSTTKLTKRRILPKGQREDSVSIYLGQNCGDNSAAWVMRKGCLNPPKNEKWIKEWPAAEEPTDSLIPQ